MVKKIQLRTLEQVCEQEDFHTEVLGNTYCTLALDKKIKCSRQAEERDHNGLYPCLDLRWNNDKPLNYSED